MATKVTGAGGFIIRGGTVGASPPYDQAVAFQVGSWDLDVEAIIGESTESDAQGWSQGLVGLYSVNSVTIELIQKYEAAAIFELSCCPISGTVNLFLKKGGTNFGNQVNGTIFKGLKVTDRSDNGDPIRQVATFTKGTVQWNLAIPASYQTT